MQPREREVDQSDVGSFVLDLREGLLALARVRDHGDPVPLEIDGDGVDDRRMVVHHETGRAAVPEPEIPVHRGAAATVAMAPDSQPRRLLDVPQRCYEDRAMRSSGVARARRVDLPVKRAAPLRKLAFPLLEPLELVDLAGVRSTGPARTKSIRCCSLVRSRESARSSSSSSFRASA